MFLPSIPNQAPGHEVQQGAATRLRNVALVLQEALKPLNHELDQLILDPLAKARIGGAVHHFV